MGMSNKASINDLLAKFLVANRYAVGTPKAKESAVDNADVRMPKLTASMTSRFCNSRTTLCALRLTKMAARGMRMKNRKINEGIQRSVFESDLPVNQFEPNVGLCLNFGAPFSR